MATAHSPKKNSRSRLEPARLSGEHGPFSKGEFEHEPIEHK